MTARVRPRWRDTAYPVLPEEVADLFRAAPPPHPSDEDCAAIAKALSEAMPAHWRRFPGFEAFGRYHETFPRQMGEILGLRRSIKRRRKVGPDPWFPANWKATLETLEQALTAAAPLLAGPTANNPPRRHWHRIGWNVAMMARLALLKAGYAKVSVSRRGQVVQFTVAALSRIGIVGAKGPVTAVAVERMLASMSKELREAKTAPIR